MNRNQASPQERSLFSDTEGSGRVPGRLQEPYNYAAFTSRGTLCHHQAAFWRDVAVGMDYWLAFLSRFLKHVHQGVEGEEMAGSQPFKFHL